MRIQELIDQLEKVKDRYPDSELRLRNGNTVDRVEVCNQGVELVLDGQQPPFAGQTYAFKNKRR